MKRKFVKKVLGLDGNALYLFAIQQNMPTRLYVRYKKENEYKPQSGCKLGLSAYQWLSWIAHSKDVTIQHQFNYGEKRLTDRNIPVDGYIYTTKTVLQFDGYY